jgi:hypothetical protein
MEKSAQTPTLLEVVAGYDHLRVEDYQRTYSWQKDQIDEFLIDLNECTISNEAHFLGTLILQESENKSATVVDGQQRLTTVYILVSALRDRLRSFSTATIKATSANERDINVIDKALDFLCYSKKLDEYRFDSSRFLKSLMRNCVLSEPDKQKPIPTRDNNGKKVTLDFRKAIVTIRNWVDNDLIAYADEVDKLQRIDSLLSALLDRFIVLKVTTGTLGESLDIFLTLNNRGLPLGPSDLVRGEIMSVLSAGLSEDEQLKLHRNILEEWTAIVEQVSEPETFLRHYLVSTSEEKIQKKKVVKEVSIRISSKDLDLKKKNAENFWKALQDAASVYGAIISPRMGGECQYQIELLEGLGKSHRVILLPILSANLDESTRDGLVRQVFVLAFRNVIAGLNAQKLEDFYQEVGYTFRKDKDSESLLVSLINRSKGFEVNALKYFTAEGDSGFAGRALLHLVNRVTTYGATLAPVSSGESHVEHIAPQTEIEHWAETLYGTDTEARKRYDDDISQIGNLTLLDKGLNLQAQRKPFIDKQDYYKNSNFGITRDLCDIPEWDLKVIKLRTNWLVEMFEIYWAIEREKGQGRITPFTEWLP